MVKVIAEIGINHNGCIDTCLNMIKAAKQCGADYVKFQKRNPDVCVPEHQKTQMRNTPWGEMTYLDYKYRIEFNKDQYSIIDDYCKKIGIKWFVSVWDLDSVKFMTQFDNSLVKVPSAKAVDTKLIKSCFDNFEHVIISTGMCTQDEIHNIAQCADVERTTVMHTVSAYPAQPEMLMMDTIDWLSERFYNVGYSSHETDITPAAASVYKGVSMIERHFTLDTNMWGTDQKTSSDPAEMSALINSIRFMESTLGTRTNVIECEKNNLTKMR